MGRASSTAPGSVVEVYAGPYAGRTGVVQAQTVEGVAVRLRGSPGWPFTSVKVIEHGHLRRVAGAAHTKPADAPASW